ncbi:MAG: ribonuclease H-like domain-containing protein [Chloroflexi bacterium]|nr:ribonuclease H-like domain-containing protein [Chloroflexota bacterium]MDA1146173.1 ribonuclease H-like domain-containing protein [Chloroflexota bacterium]
MITTLQATAIPEEKRSDDRSNSGAPASLDARRPRTVAEAAATRVRLRALIADIENRAPRLRVPEPHPAPVPYEEGAPRNLLASATRRETERGPFTYREVRYPLSHEAGHQPLAEITALSAETLELLAPEEGLADAALGDLYFLDIETTGLGGAGAIAFLVATARFEVDAAGAPTELVLAQYLAESPPEEAGLLEALIADARFADDPVLVTYNGRTFDAPLLDERATMHRRRAGFYGLRQLDLLRPARTGYRSLLPNCKLATMEHEILGMTRPSEDIPGAEVPHWYFRFLRTGDQRMLTPIIEHNELDVVGMVGLLAWHAAHLDAGRAPGQRDALGLGRLLAARGLDDRAVTYLERARRADAAAEDPQLIAAAEAGESPSTGRSSVVSRAYAGRTAYAPAGRPALGGSQEAMVREEALLRLAALHKRRGARALAAQLWHEALAIPARAPLGPLIELAMYYEHDQRDYERAIAHTEAAARHVAAQLQRHDQRRSARLVTAIEYRLARLHSRVERARRAT